jgi:predicted metalloprotease with PDZ domain
VERVTAELTGLDLKGFFDRAVRGCGELELAPALDRVGIGFGLRPARGAADQGGVKESTQEKEPAAPRLVLGVATRSEGRDVVITNVFDRGAAQRAGISAGDVLIAIDGLRVTEANMDNLMARAINGTPLEVHVFRRDELMRFEVTPLPAVADTCELWISEPVDKQTVDCRQAWLSTVQVTAWQVSASE